MRRVIIESPYAGQVQRNKLYLQDCIRDCINLGESPYASHQMLTDALNDLHPEERKQGINAGMPWYEAADAVVVYRDFGISGGMHIGINRAIHLNKPLEYRELGGVWEFWASLQENAK